MFKKKEKKERVVREFNIFERVLYNFGVRSIAFIISMFYIYVIGFVLSTIMYPLLNSVMIKTFGLAVNADNIAILSFSVIPSVIFTMWLGAVIFYFSVSLYKRLDETVKKHLIKKGATI